MNNSEDSVAPSLRSLAPIVPVRDMENSIKFYRRLGFDFEAYEDGTEYAFLRRDSLDLHLRRAGAGELIHNPCGIYFYVRGVDGLFAELVAAGVICLHPPENKPWRMREFAVGDPDGTLLRFGQRAQGNEEART